MSEDFGKRLKQERDRLGLSQAEFAQKVGVHRNTQVRYEGGTREPDADYLSRLNEIGVDTGFLFFGQKTDPLSVYQLAVARFLPSVAERAGLSGAALIDLINLVAEDESACWFGSGYSRINTGDLEDALFENGTLLADVFNSVDIAVETQGVELTYGKRAQVVAMLYRVFKASGKVDQTMVEEAVKLAAG